MSIIFKYFKQNTLKNTFFSYIVSYNFCFFLSIGKQKILKLI